MSENEVATPTLYYRSVNLGVPSNPLATGTCRREEELLTHLSPVGGLSVS